MKKFLSFLGASLFALGFVGCSNELDNSKDLLLLQSAASKSNISSSSKTGSFTYESQESRSISVSDIKSAKVTLTGYDSNGNNFSKSSDLVAVSGGKGTNISVSEVPVADNVVVTVQSYSDDKGTVQVAGGVIRSVVKISSGPNSGSADWATSRKGNIYNALYEGGVNTNTLSSSYVSSIETLVGNLETAKIHANLIDVEKILSIVKSNGSLSTVAADYKIATGTVTATVYGYSGKSVQIADPASSAQTAGADGSTLTFVDVLPGTWNVYADGEKVKTIKVSAGNNDVTIGNPYSGHMVVYTSAASAPKLWIWQVSGSYTDGKDVLGCDWNNRPTMVAADGMCNNNGWYMYDLTANNCNFTSGIAFNIILNDNGNVETGKTATFWYDAAGSCGTAGAFYDSDPTANQLSSDATLSSISVNGTAISGFAAGTTTYTSSISASTTSAAVTAVANDSAATVSVSPDGSASIASGSSQVFTITVTAEDGTTKTYTVTVKRAAENDTTLASITVNGKAASISGTTATLSASGSEDSLTISSIIATAVDSNATVSYSATTGTVYNGGSKSFTITVKNGSKSATYTLTVSYTKVDTPEYYWTNKNGAYGTNKTISGFSSWSESDKIIQGVACDTPRCWLGGHEYPDPDLYAMFAAWDDTNLYLLIEIPNVDDADAVDNDKCYAGSQFLPMGIVLNTGKRTAGNGTLDNGNSVWQGSELYTWENGIDTMLMFHPRLGIGEPSVFKTQADGTFTYESTVTVAANKKYCIGFTTAGVTREVYFNKCVSSNMWAAVTDDEGNWGNKSSTDMSTYSYVDYLAAGKNMSSYQVTIPLASIDITKDYIESTGISVGCFSTYGASTMDCLPWDPCMVDVAAEGYSSDPSSSKEKEDLDNITVPLARIGK